MTEVPSGRMLRIAAHNGAPEWGGAEIAVSRLLAALQSRGHTVNFFCNRPLVMERAATFGLEVSRLHVGGDASLFSSVRVARALSRFDADVLLVGTFRKTLHLALGAKAALVPVVSRIGLATDLPRNAKYRWLFRRVVRHTVVSATDVAERYRQLLPSMPEDRLEVIPKGIAVPEGIPSKAEARRSLGLPEQGILVGLVARLVRAKRGDRFIEAVARVPGCTGVVVGDGPERTTLEEHARHLGQIDRIRFTGRLDDPWPALAALDLLVVSSDTESMANVMLEAMALGVPVLSTPVSGAHDVLVEGVDPDARPGRVTSDFGPGTLASALQRMVHEPALRERMSEAARQRVANRHSMETYVDRWEATLRRVAKVRKP
ncbi:MAG: glycosyltransferase [Gemmatimonadetes bacterium]|nr:glycosyltransferase [Gemmatimonadota bacterium]